MLICGLYCLLRFPDTSSAQGITQRLNTGLPFAVARMGFGEKSFTQSVFLSGMYLILIHLGNHFVPMP